MPPLHLTKVAVGVAHVETFVRRVASRARDGEVRYATRMRPKRMDELIGGQLHWIIKHKIVARQLILRFDNRSDGRLDIVCAETVDVLPPTPKRGHQGWRYLADGDAPGVAGDSSGLGELPPHLVRELSELKLI